MVLSFFRKDDGETGFDNITQRTVSMLADARHSYDLASMILLSEAGPDTVAADILSTDERINRAEQEVRRELVTHVAVHGGFDIGEVLGYTLLIKKIERIGDQAKNILWLAEEGVSFAGEADAPELNETRRLISELMGECGDLLGGNDIEQMRTFRDHANAVADDLESQIFEFMHTELPGSHAVPRAILLRYWKRIVANLAGVLGVLIEPVHQEVDPEEESNEIADS